MRVRSLVLAVGLAVLTSGLASLGGVRSSRDTAPAHGPTVDDAAARYVRLVSALGARDPDTLDVDGGRASADDGRRLTLREIGTEARALEQTLRERADGSRRVRHLRRQLIAVATRADLLDGHRLSWPEELDRLFQTSGPAPILAGRVAPDRVLTIDRLLPRQGGDAASRLSAYEQRFIVPPDRLPAVFLRALEECRGRTRAFLTLPDDETTEVAWVEGQPWSGFSRYLGGHRSRIEVNVSFPLTVDRVLDLACHEGYPGHHTLSTLRDVDLPGSWPERTTMPLFSPDSFRLEALASWAGDVAFSPDARLAFERDVLFPLAGLAPSEAAHYLAVIAEVDARRLQLGQITARYLSGDLDIVEASWALRASALMASPLPTLQFVNRYRGYGLAYTLGRGQLAPWLGPTVPPVDRWSRYRDMAAPEIGEDAVAN